MPNKKKKTFLPWLVNEEITKKKTRNLSHFNIIFFLTDFYGAIQTTTNKKNWPKYGQKTYQ